MPELLRPPTHRGPLIAAGGVLLTLGILLEEFRIDEDLAAGWHLAICAAAAALFLAIAVQWPAEGGRPPASQSILVVCGLALLLVALTHLADVLGADSELGSSTLTWILLVFGGVALIFSTRKRSAIAAFLAAVALGGALLSAWDWIFSPEAATPFRWLLLLLSLVYILVSLVLRGGSPRHSEQMVNAAGLAILAIPAMSLFVLLFGFGFGGGEPGSILPGFWELIVLAAGCGLVAYGAVDRAPGPAYLGVANLAAFVAVVTTFTSNTLEWWPFTLLVVGAVALIAGLRPRRPLPPEPDGYSTRDLPLAARSDGETVVNVRHQ